MKEALRKILAGWHGVLIDFRYWQDLIGMTPLEAPPDGWVANPEDFFNYLGEWLEGRPHSPAPWASSVVFCTYASIQWVQGKNGGILTSAPRHKNIDLGDEL